MKPAATRSGPQRHCTTRCSISGLSLIRSHQPDRNPDDRSEGGQILPRVVTLRPRGKNNGKLFSSAGRALASVAPVVGDSQCVCSVQLEGNFQTGILQGPAGGRSQSERAPLSCHLRQIVAILIGGGWPVRHQCQQRNAREVMTSVR